MNIKRFFAAFVVLFLFIFGYETLIGLALRNLRPDAKFKISEQI